MFELANPWALALIVLPLLMRLLPAYRESRDSVRVPFFDKLVELSEQRPGSGAMILRESTQAAEVLMRRISDDPALVLRARLRTLHRLRREKEAACAGC